MNLPTSLRGVSGRPGMDNRYQSSFQYSHSPRRVSDVPPKQYSGPKSRKVEGFTLIELFVVLLIVGILASIGLPGFANLIKEARLDSATDKVTTAVNAARNYSVNLFGVQNLVMCPSNTVDDDVGDYEPVCLANTVTDYQTGWLTFIDCDNDRQIDYTPVDCNGNGLTTDPEDNEQLLRVQNSFNNIEIETTNTDRLIFDRSGRATSSPQFDVKLDGITYASVIVNDFGIALLDPNDDFWNTQ